MDFFGRNQKDIFTLILIIERSKMISDSFLLIDYKNNKINK